MPDHYDDDVPFHLPMEPGHEDDDEDIHKIDTEDIEIPVELQGGESSEEIARLQAEDAPDIHDAPTVDNLPPVEDDEAQYTIDHDVPFRLPKEPTDAEPQPPGKISNQWATMPHEPRAEPTVQNMPPVQQPPDHARYQRPPARGPIPPPPQQRPASQPQRPLPRKRRKRGGNFGWVAIAIGLFVTLCGGLTLITGVAGVWAYARVGDLVDERLADFDAYDNFESTFIYDRDGRPLFEVFNEGRRTNVDLADMPDDLINATIAIEDDSFYGNIGIDIGATFVATMQYIGASAGEDTPGGSTITQQLVRNVLFTPEYRAERSVERKVEEILLAIALTGRWDKDDILELYLNEIYYGNLAYGAQAASQIFFGKDVGELTLGEAALLAGLPQAPADLDPLNPDPDVQAAVRNRWVQVLNEMVEERYITQAEMDAALQQGLTFSSPDIDLRAPHFTVYAQSELEDLMLELGYSTEEIARGGLRVYTTVDLEMNDNVQRLAADQINALDPTKNVSNAAVVVIKPLTGEILGMVGSIDYTNEAIDGNVNVTIRQRQPGSTMKPFTYAAAMELGFTPGDAIWDTRIEVPQPGREPYVPRNYDGSFHGPMRMRAALANSYNIPAVQTLRFVGVDYLLQFMYRVGVESLGLDPSRFGVALTLGGGEVTLLELTNAYGVFANEGLHVEATSILCVLNNDNEIIYEYESGCPTTVQGRPVTRTAETVTRTGLGTRVLDERIAFVISSMLSDEQARRPEMGANSALFTPNIGSSVKTGTTDDVKDNWTVGYTRNVAVGVWVGNNDGDPMRNTTGLTGAAPIWNDVMTSIYANDSWLNQFRVDGQIQPDQPTAPPGVSQQRLCRLASLADPAQTCSPNVTEWLLDYPARLPDGRGGMVDQAAQQSPQRPSTGSYVELAQPGIYQATVAPIDPNIAQQIQFPVQPGEPTPPPPRYCRVPVELIDAAPGTIQNQLFIAPPLVGRDAVEAELYAQRTGLAFLPTIECTQQLINAASAGPSVVTAFISEPQANQTISGSVPILGTAQFSQNQAVYYKLDIIGGQWTTWTTIQDVNYSPVVNGTLGTLPVLPSGSYRLRLVLVGTDGNHLQNPYEVPFNVP